MRWFVFAALLGLAACGGGTAEVAPSTNPVTSSSTTTEPRPTTTERTLDTLRADQKAKTAKAAKDCLSREYDRNCYAQVASLDKGAGLMFTDPADAEPKWRDVDYVSCVGNAFVADLSDADLRSWVTVLAGETTVGRELLAEIYGAGFSAFNQCDREADR